jgi:hypothetical protein
MGGWLAVAVCVLGTAACTEEALPPAGYPEPPMNSCRATFEVRTCEGVFHRDLTADTHWRGVLGGWASIELDDPEFSTELELRIPARPGSPVGLYEYDPEVDTYEWQAVVCWIGCNEFYGFAALIDFEHHSIYPELDLVWAWGTFHADTGLDVTMEGDVVVPACEDNVIQVRGGHFACVYEAP